MSDTSTIATHWKHCMKSIRFIFIILTRAWSVPLTRKFMYSDAIVRLIGAWVLIKLVPYKLWRDILGQPGTYGAVATLTFEQAEMAYNIASLHGVLQKAFGTRFTCLMLALSARGMLKARDVPSQLILGVNRKASEHTGSPLCAHAWVTSFNVQIIGHESSETFTAVAFYDKY